MITAVQPSLFDYMQLDTETRIVVQQRTEEIKSLMRSALGNMIEAGRKCSEVRGLLRHNKSGGFDGWIDAEGIGRSTAYSIIGLYEAFGNCPNFGQLDIAKTAAYLLAAPSTPELARIEAIERAQAGETITHRVATGIVDEAKEKAIYRIPEPTLIADPYQAHVVSALPLSGPIDYEDQAEELAEDENAYNWTDDSDEDEPLFCPGCMAWRDDSDVWVNETYDNQYEKYTSAKVVTCNQCGTTASYELAQGGQDCHSCKFYMPDTRADEFPFCLKLETRTSPDVMRCGGDKWVWESASALQDQADLEERSAIDEVVTKPHVANNTGDNEWYTPAHIIEAARSVMGGIDLDPASSEVANATVQATTYYTEMDNGLAQDWSGRVWMNPPYASDLIGGFCAKLVRHYRDGEIDQSIVLVNNATETGWFCELISVASAIVFPKGRIRFLKGDGVLGAPLQGQAIIYIGNQSQLFYDQFVNYGWGAIL